MNTKKHFLNKLCTTGLITLLIGGSTVAFADPNSAQQKTANKITQVTNSDSKAKLDIEKDIYTHLVQNDHFTSAAAVAVTGYMGFESDFIPSVSITNDGYGLLQWTPNIYGNTSKTVTAQLQLLDNTMKNNSSLLQQMTSEGDPMQAAKDFAINYMHVKDLADNDFYFARLNSWVNKVHHDLTKANVIQPSQNNSNNNQGAQ